MKGTSRDPRSITWKSKLLASEPHGGELRGMAATAAICSSSFLRPVSPIAWFHQDRWFMRYYHFRT